MMNTLKKYSGYFIRYILVISLLGLLLLDPIKVDAKANTLRELRTELKALKDKKAANASKKSLTKKEINNKNSQIDKAYNEITSSQTKVAEAKATIEKTNAKINELKAKNKELMTYFQIMQGENVYLEFVSNSSTMTELIMRNDAINRLAEYQQEKLVEMNDLIKVNEQTQVDMKKYEKELENNITKYKQTVQSLEDDLSALDEIGLDIDDEIQSKQELIKAYEEMGCKEDEDLDVCSQINGSATWLKPLKKGRINSIFGTRTDPFTGQKKVHKAVDIGGNPEGTKVYAVGNGVVLALRNAEQKHKETGKKYCGGTQVYIQVKIAGKYYVTIYAHLLKLYVKVGDKVTADTVIGLQGGGSGTKKWESCSTGTHLHFGVSEGKPSKNQTVSSFHSANVIVPPGFPKKGAWFYSRTQWFK